MRCGIIALIFLLVLGACSVLALAGDDMTPADVAKIRYVSGAVISPDGKWIAYSLVVPRDPLKDNGNAAVELHVADARNGQSRPFVTGGVSVSQIGWSSDSRTIMYLSKRGDDKSTSLYGIAIDGGESAKILEHETAISKYAWHPDGKQLAFLAKKKEGEEKKKLADRGFNAEAYEEELQNTLVWIVVPGQEEAVAKPLDLAGSASEIEWDPAGNRLAVALAPTPLIDHYYMYRRIRIVDGDGKIETKIENPGKLGAIRWSPDGKRLAIISGEDINDPAEARLILADPQTGKFERILADYVPDVLDVHWIDNETLSVLGANGCQSELHRCDIATQALTRELPPQGTVFTAISYSDDSAYALVGESPANPPEVYSAIAQGDDKSPKKLTDNNSWLSEKRLAPQEVVRYEARDGVMIEGILVYPRDRKEGERYPLILTVHGGPESHVPNGWVTRYSYPGQVAAARGFAVFYPNYRGSTGRGAAFAKSHQADYGGKEFDDLLDAVNHLVRQGLVNRRKVGVTGGSYGGFASAWCATRHSEQFAASVMFVGISNQISKSGTTDIPDEMFHVHARKRIWEDWQFFLERSPVYYVEKAKTPILILHGKEDTRVHPSQSMELYRNLKILGKVPVRLVLYPGEGHGNRKAAARYDYNLRLMRWMEHYLKGEGGDPPAFKLDPDKVAE